MKVFLLALLGLASFAAVQGEDAAVVEHDKLQGKWHTMAIGTNCEQLLKHWETMKTVTSTLTKLEDGGVKVASFFPTPDGCKNVEMIFRMQEDGKLVHECEWGTQVVDTVETDYENYAIVSISIPKGVQSTCRVISFFVRDPVPGMTAVHAEKMKSATQEAGIPEANIHIFPKEVACQEKA